MAKSKSQIEEEVPDLAEEGAEEPVAEVVEAPVAPAEEAPAVEAEKSAAKPGKKAVEPVAEASAEKTVKVINRAYAGLKVGAGSVVAQFDAEGIAEVPEGNAELFLRIPGFSRA